MVGPKQDKDGKVYFFYRSYDSWVHLAQYYKAGYLFCQNAAIWPTNLNNYVREGDERFTITEKGSYSLEHVSHIFVDGHEFGKWTKKFPLLKEFKYLKKIGLQRTKNSWLEPEMKTFFKGCHGLTVY